jgi:hypothetical protein
LSCSLTFQEIAHATQCTGPYGPWSGREELTDVAVQAVRIRRGNTVNRGEYLGSKEKPFAFIWRNEEEAPVPTREIIVRVGYKGEWLWENESCIDLKIAFPRNKEAARLVRPFEDWQRFFEKYYDESRSQRFFWGRFHEDGLKLARRLQAALIDVAIVRYQCPAEDRQSQTARDIEL